MKRIQTAIARVTIAEKEERAKRKIVQTFVLGYDPELWMDTPLKIRSEDNEIINFEHLNLPSPNGGRHRYIFCKQLYYDVHALKKNKNGPP